ncbi:MAG: ABC transporter ATP-binding protein [Bacillota bacterium]
MGGESAPVIVCRDLYKNYGRTPILRGVNLEVPPGSLFALLGTNGAGKTTLIRTLLGLIPRSKGEISILGVDPGEAGPRLRERIGYVSEEQGLYGWMRVSRLVDFCRGLYTHWNQSLVESYLARFALPLQARVGSLSKGERVRLALILALGPEPELLILDEPMNGLDPLAQHEFLRIVQEAAVKRGRTIFFSTHNLADVEAIATHVAILGDGVIKAMGPLDEVRSLVRRIKTGKTEKALPAGAMLLEEDDLTSTYLMPVEKEAKKEWAATGSSGAILEESPATLREVFIYFCGRRG